MISVVGSGSIRANLTAFGGNQYHLPEQANQLKNFFSIQIFFLKIGSLLGRFVSPILKGSVKCFGSSECYPLAFGTPGVAMIMAFGTFVSGKSFFIRKPPSGNMLIKVGRCVAVKNSIPLIWRSKNFETFSQQNAISEKLKKGKLVSKNHWLDYAEEKHGAKLVSETKTVMNILVLYLPLPIYWAVYMQQGSRWIFQATRMNGDLGFYTVHPDQLIAMNPFFSILTLPLCDYVIHPLLEIIGIKSLLQKMTVGGMLGVIAFIIAAIVEMKIQNDFVNIFWLAPQYFILALSETLLYVSHLSFAYNEASPRMKSVMMSAVYVVIAVGHLIIVLISGTKLFESQAIEFLCFAGVLFIFMIGFGFLASRYEQINQNNQTDKN